MSIASIIALVVSGQAIMPTTSMQAALFKSGTSQSVKLLWYPARGWVPANGYRVYRRVGTQRILVFPTAGFLMTRKTNSGLPQSLLKRNTDWAAIWSLAGEEILQAGKVSNPPNTETATVPISSKPQFDELKKLLTANEVDAAALTGNYASLPSGNPLKVRTTSALNGYRISGAETNSEQILNARRRIIGTVVASESFGLQVGLRLEDMIPIGSSTPTRYELHSMNGIVESKSPIASVNIPLTITSTPSVLSLIEGFQSDEGKISLRWKRPSIEEEGEAGGLIRYRIYRDGTRLNRVDSAIMDAEQANGSTVEPIAFFVDQEVPQREAIYTYRVDSIDVFGRIKSSGTVQVGSRDLRIPFAPSFFLPVAFKPSAITSNAPADAKATILFSIPKPELIGEFQVSRQDLENTNLGWTQVPLTRRVSGVLGLGFDSPPMGSTAELTELVRQIYGPERASRSTNPELRRLVTEFFKDQLPVITFDSTALKDRFYKYRIRAKSPAGVWSGYTESIPCGIPLEESPGKVVDLDAVFEPATNLSSFKGLNTNQFVRTGQLTSRVQPKSGLQLAPLPPVGGTVKLSWNHSSSQRGVTYRVQRKLPGNKNWENLKLSHPEQSFTDKLPLTYKTSVVYRVTPVNRWAVDGTPTLQIVPVPSTKTPGNVDINKISLNEDGSLTISFGAGLAKEQIASYRILRKVTENVPPAKIDKRLLFGRKSSGLQGLQGVSTETQGMNELQRRLSPLELEGYVELGSLSGNSATSESGNISWTDLHPVESKQNWYVVICETSIGIKSEVGTPLGAVPLKISASSGTNFAGAIIGNSVRLTWKNASDTVSVQVLRRLKQAPVEQNIELAGAVAAESYLDVTARKGRAYVYTVRYRDKKGNLSSNSELEIVVPFVR